jgi:hypothetical protein
MYLRKGVTNKHKNCWQLERHRRKEKDLEPDPLVDGTNPSIRIRIRIHTNMSRIQNMNVKVAFGSRTQSTRNICTAAGCKDHKDILTRDLQSFFLCAHLFRLGQCQQE